VNYASLVPARYHKGTGVERHTFQVVEPWHCAYNYVLHPQGGAMPISPSAYCEVATKSGYRPVLIDIRVHPALAEAVLSLGQMMFTGGRIQKYLLLFRAHECLSETPQIEYAALRHALTHATSKLNRPRTVRTLTRLLGTTSFDPGQSTHLRQFWSLFVRMLIDNDSLLAVAITASLSSIRVLSGRADALLDWRIKGDFGEAPLKVNLEPPGGIGAA
jgi:hypothetical protein